MLYADPADETPLRPGSSSARSPLSPWSHDPRGAPADHRGPRRAGAARLSVIGHSLDVLDTGLPTIVCHDYYPWCPAINSTRRRCQRRDGARAECESGNPDYNPFAGFGARSAWRCASASGRSCASAVKVAAPSESVGRNLKRPSRFADLAFNVIAHGYAAPCRTSLARCRPRSLRVLVLGHLAGKGQKLCAALPASRRSRT